MNIEEITQQITDMVINYAPKFALAIITLIIGMWVIKRLMNWVEPTINKSTKDETLSQFLASILCALLKVMLLLSVASMFGIDATSFIAVFGALMVGIGMPLNGSIGHVASGVMLMIFKPFKVGDLVKIGGGQTTGTIESINAFNTVLATLDNKRIIIANSNVTGNDITNISGQGTVGVELTFSIAYNADIDKAKSVIKSVGDTCPYILDNPEQGVVVANLGSSSVDIATRPFCKSEHYWDTMFYMKEEVKKQFDLNQINIPFPNMEIHMMNQGFN
ncbi:mechanosensitive ion channel family protein [Bacteroidia bacterium]|nr:mechanosensitive ion channel family protein [Bacteroidia bacterium]